MLARIALALLLYPGLLLVLLAAVRYALLAEGHTLASLRRLLAQAQGGATGGVQPEQPEQPEAPEAPETSEEPPSRPTGPGIEGLASIASMGCACLGLVVLPWPLHPAPSLVTLWLWAWAAFEGAFLLPLLPALLAGWPPLVRAASREAQIGIAGRMVLWLALAVGLLLPTGAGSLSLALLWSLPAYGLALIAAFFVLPAALTWGPFAAETSISPGGTTDGLNSAATALDTLARMVRCAALLVASLLALLPIALLPATPLFSMAGVAAVILAFELICRLLQRSAGRVVRHTLPTALDICWWRGLPAALAALLYLSLS